MQEKMREIMELMAKNEEKVSELYMSYADKFVDNYNFWLMLSEEETSHAAWIRNLNNPVLSETLVFDEKRFAPEGILLFSEYLVQKLKEVRETDYTFQKALNTALDIENALIEKKWFDTINSDSAEARINLDRLRDALIKHKNKITQTLADLKGSV